MDEGGSSAGVPRGRVSRSPRRPRRRSSRPVQRSPTFWAAADSRLLVLVGPCSIHDTAAAREYGWLLKNAIDEYSNDLRIVMRVYFEKPRTTIGWKGLINDPYLDQSYKINDGLRQARHLLLDLAEIGRADGNRVSGHDFAAVYCGAGELGRDWSADHGEPGSPAACVGRFVPGGLQECDLGRCAGGDRRDSVGGALAYIPWAYEARSIGDFCDDGKSRLPHYFARRAGRR